MSHSSMITNILQTYRPRHMSLVEWTNWLSSNSASEEQISRQILSMANVDLGETLSAKEKNSPFGLGHPCIFQILYLVDRELGAAHGSNLNKMRTTVSQIHLTMDLKSKVGITPVNIRSAEALCCSSILIGMLEVAGKSEAQKLNDIDCDKSVHQILAFQIHNSLVELWIYYSQKMSSDKISDMFFPTLLFAAQIAQKFICNKPLEYSEWKANQIDMIRSSKDGLSEDLCKDAYLRLNPNIRHEALDIILKNYRASIKLSIENSENILKKDIS